MSKPLPRPSTLLFALVTLLVTRRASAQSAEDHVYVGARVAGAARLDDRPGKRASQIGEAHLAAPLIVLGERDRLSLRLSYVYRGIDVGRSAVIGDEPRRWNLHAISPGVTYSRILGRRWVLSLGVGPGIVSDLRSRFSFDDVQISGYGSLTYFVGGDPGFRLSIAVLAQNRSVLTPVLPFVTLDYRNRDVALSGGLGGAHALVLAGDRAEIGVFGSFGGGQYHVRSGREDERLRRAKYLSLIDFGAGPELNVRVAGPVWLEVKGSYNFLQSGRFNDPNLERVPGLGLDAKGAFVGQLGVGIR